MQIEVQHAEYCYQPGTALAHKALEDVNLRIGSGELIAVIGHGGSGKSTLALLLSGLYQPTAGRVDTYDVKNSSNAVFSSIGLVFQYPEQQLFAETVYEEVAFGAKNFGVPQDYLPIRVRKALEQVGLDPDVFWDRSPFSLSGGQKRRVCIAGVLAVEPKMIILDEPAAGLDEEGRLWLIDLVRQLNQQGRTILWVTHNMQEAAELAKRIIVMDHGRILLDGSPQQVFAQEELLAQASLEIPMAASIVRELRKRGLNLPGEALTVAEAAAEISDYLAHKDDPLTEEEPPAPVITADLEEDEPEISLESVLAAASTGPVEAPADFQREQMPEPHFSPWLGGEADA